MKIDKAIEIKIQWRKNNYPPPLADEMNADMVSIEALKGIISLRRGLGKALSDLLPGETKD